MEATVTYLMPVDVTVDLDTGRVLRVVVDDQADLPDRPYAYDGPEGREVDAHTIADLDGAANGWPEWEVAS